MAKTERNGFVVYHEIKDTFELLSYEQIGKLFEALVNYSITQEILPLDKECKLVFLLQKQKIDIDKEHYESKCKQMQANASKCKQMQANASKSDQLNKTKLNKTKLNKTKLNKTKLKETKEKEEEINKEEEKEKQESSSTPFLSVFIDKYGIESDIYSMTVVRDLDFYKILKAFEKSTWLRTEIKSLKWIVNNYQKIISDAYIDKAKPNKEEKVKKAIDVIDETYKRYSDEESDNCEDLF